MAALDALKENPELEGLLPAAQLRESILAAKLGEGLPMVAAETPMVVQPDKNRGEPEEVATPVTILASSEDVTVVPQAPQLVREQVSAKEIKTRVEAIKEAAGQLQQIAGQIIEEYGLDPQPRNGNFSWNFNATKPFVDQEQGNVTYLPSVSARDIDNAARTGVTQTAIDYEREIQEATNPDAKAKLRQMSQIAAGRIAIVFDGLSDQKLINTFGKKTDEEMVMLFAKRLGFITSPDDIYPANNKHASVGKRRELLIKHPTQNIILELQPSAFDEKSGMSNFKGFTIVYDEGAVSQAPQGSVSNVRPAA